MFENCLTTFKTFSKKFENNSECLKNQRLTNEVNEQFTIAFRRNSPLRERLSLEAPSDNREKKKRNVFILHCEKISTFSSRAKRAHGREAPRKTLTCGSARSTENPTGAEFLAKKGPVGSPSSNFGHFGWASKKIKSFYKFL